MMLALSSTTLVMIMTPFLFLVTPDKDQATM